MLRRWLSAGALAMMVGTGSAASQATAADSLLESRTRAISSLLRCPVCQGESIQDSPAELSAQMRDLVREQLRAGRTDEEVKQYFVDRYGEWILLEPKPEGANLLLYLAPVLVVAGGLAFVWRVVRRWSSPRLTSESDQTAATINSAPDA